MFEILTYRPIIAKHFLISHLKTWIYYIIVFVMKMKCKIQWDNVVSKWFLKLTQHFWPPQLRRRYFVPCADPPPPPQFIEYSRALTALILPSIPACYPNVTLDSPHGKDPIKTCKNIWEVQLPGMQLATVTSETKEQESSQELLWRHSTNLTAFSITHQWASKAFGLADVQWEKVNVAQPVMTLSVFKWDHSLQTNPVWARTQQYLTISGVLVWDRMDILTFNAGYK